MKKAVLTLWALGLASVSLADQPIPGLFTYKYDLESTTITYCKTVGPIQGKGLITSSGTALTGSQTDSFTATQLAENDVIVSNVAGTRQFLLVYSVTDGNDLVLVSAPGTALTSAQWEYYDTQCGTGATDGWVSFKGYEPGSSITFQPDQFSATGGVDVRIECRGSYIGALSNQVFPECDSGECATEQNYTTAGITSTTQLSLQESQGECRVGLQIVTGDDSITITLNSNDDIDFTEGTTGAALATLTAGVYTDGATLATEIETQINAAATDNTYTVTYSRSTRKFTITRATGTDTIAFPWQTGANTATSAKTALGFANTDDTGATTYTSDTGVTIDDGTLREEITIGITKVNASK